jgi:tRNA1(Val) A37 N6-methylase TrmN6
VENRIEELAHHIRIEKAVVDGSQKYIKMLQPSNSKDKNSLKEVQKQRSVSQSVNQSVSQSEFSQSVNPPYFAVTQQTEPRHQQSRAAEDLSGATYL